jgi:glutamine synthetase
MAGLDGVAGGLPAPEILDRDPALLDPEEARRFGVGGHPQSLQESLKALEADAVAQAWMEPLLLEAHLSVKRAELQALGSLSIEERCLRYARVY